MKISKMDSITNVDWMNPIIVRLVFISGYIKVAKAPSIPATLVRASSMPFLILGRGSMDKYHVDDHR